MHIDFTNKRIQHRILYIENREIPYYNKAKYLGMILDAKLYWIEHVKVKKYELDIKYSQVYWIISRRSVLSIYNKLLKALSLHGLMECLSGDAQAQVI